MKECEWIWTHDQRDAFEEIKDAVKKSTSIQPLITSLQVTSTANDAGGTGSTTEMKRQ